MCRQMLRLLLQSTNKVVENHSNSLTDLEMEHLKSRPCHIWCFLGMEETLPRPPSGLLAAGWQSMLLTELQSITGLCLHPRGSLPPPPPCLCWAPNFFPFQDTSHIRLGLILRTTFSYQIKSYSKVPQLGLPHRYLWKIIQTITKIGQVTSDQRCCWF